jgi:hypothetical protein
MLIYASLWIPEARVNIGSRGGESIIAESAKAKSISFRAKMRWRRNLLTSQHLSPLLTLSVLCHCISLSLGLSFAQWGKPCKIPDPKTDELIDERFECDVAKGLICEKYTQGVYCGCRAGGSLTFDRTSGECRRKVAAECHLASDPIEYERLPFNRKCHENAECTRYNGTLIGTTEASTLKNKLNTPICLCKVGFVANRDLSTCVNPNGTQALVPTPSLLITLLISSLFLKVLS